LKFYTFNEDFYFLEVTFRLSNNFSVILLSLFTLRLVIFGRFGKKSGNPRWRIQDGSRFENMA